MSMDALERRLGRALARAVTDFELIAEGDRILVAVSGGKDSYTMLHFLRELQRKAPVTFTLKVVNVDQGHPGYPGHLLRGYMAREGYDFTMIEEDTYSIVTEKIPAGKTYCSLCSRLRRGILYRIATELGCSKIALGHHRDDIIETLFLNMFFGGRLKAMAPKLASEDGRHVVIRPLAYVPERDIARYARGRAFPLIPCQLCGAQENMQRVAVKNMLAAWEREYPGRNAAIFAALQNVMPAHLADPRQFDFAQLRAGAVATMSDSQEQELEIEIASVAVQAA